MNRVFKIGVRISIGGGGETNNLSCCIYIIYSVDTHGLTPVALEAENYYVLT